MGVALVFSSAVGCGDGGGEASSSTENDVSSNDLSISFDMSVQDIGVSQDTGVSEDVGPEDAGNVTQQDVGSEDLGPSDTGSSPLDCPGGPLCECEANGDCDNGQCIETPAGKQCAEPCVDKCSDDVNFKCTTVEASGGDVFTICVPKYGHMCDPCTEDKACKSLGLPDSLCVDHGSSGAYCAVACDVESQCKEGFSCLAVKSIGGIESKQCVPDPVAGRDALYGECTCSSSAVKKKLSTACYIESVDPEGNESKCEGKRICQIAGLSKCTAPSPESEVCDGVDNDCDGDIDEASCDDNNACTQDACKASNPAGDKCIHIELSDTPCNADDNVCTVDDTCQKGICVPGKLKNCNDKNPCTKDACDPSAGCTQTFDDGAPCDDDDLCTTGEICKQGQCSKGEPKDCSTANPCVVGACNLTSGKCKYVDQPKGTPCEDGNVCTVGDGCLGGACLAGGSKDCNDGNACTNDSCETKGGCVHVFNTAPCDDGALCTVGDLCKGGSCKGGTPKKCADNNVCTADSCEAKTGKCLHLGQPNDAQPCDADGSLCTVGDACKSGLCLAGAPVKCGDGKACTVNTCNGATGKCESDPKKLEGTPCDADGSLCTVKDSCKAGACVAGPQKQCDDGDVCTNDACDPKTGCTHLANVALCDDGDACTVGDACMAKICVAGKAKVCEDNNLCTLDSCESKTGCVYKPNTGKTQACYEGKPPETQGKGLCKAGVASCGADGKLGACVGQVTPQLEVCDGADNNCDGIKDEGCKAGTWAFSLVPVAISGGAAGKTKVQAWGGRTVTGESAVQGAKYKVSWSLADWLAPKSGK